MAGASPPDEAQAGERRFRRFGEAMASDASAASLGLTPPPPAPTPVVELEEPSGDAFAAKAFIGPHATYYDDRWRWMSWRGRSHGWNWAAAGTLGVWLAYRKMYRWAAVYLVVFALLLLLALSGAPLVPLAGLFVAGTLALGTFGNILYFHHFRTLARAIERTYPDHASRLKAVVAAGGVDPAAARLMVLNLLCAGAFALLIGLLTGHVSLG